MFRNMYVSFLPKQSSNPLDTRTQKNEERNKKRKCIDDND